MKCASCGFDNPQANKFCGGCGAGLNTACNQCGFENPAGFAFCGQCGQDLAKASAQSVSAAAPTPLPPAPVDSAERRHLTILFCDLVDSTPLADRLDPEDLRALVLQYQAAAGRAIDRYDGHVAQYLGDGLLVYFGFPTAHEDDARRALYSALEILEAMRELNDRLQQRWGVELAVRIGIHSGSVVTGDVGTQQRSERLAVGQAPNIAARLQSIAGRNEVLLSDSTAEIVHGRFRLEDLGAQTLKGVSEQMNVYRLSGETDVRDRFQSAGAAGLSPFVGRERELAMISAAMQRVQAGAGEVVLIHGEPGMGKSRLIEHMRDQSGHDIQWIALACSPYHTNSAMYPLSAYFGRLLGFRAVDDAAVRLEKAEAYLDRSWVDRKSIVPFLAPILGLQPGEEYPSLPLSAKQIKDQTFDMLDRLLFGGNEAQVTVLVIEDLHWADPSTREFMDYLVLVAPSRPVLMMASSRTEHDEWGDFSHITNIDLQPLTRTDVTSLVNGLVADTRVPKWVRQEIETRTDGVPIFVEELTKMMLRGSEAAHQDPGDLPQAIPSTLQDSLTARLDGLGDARDTLQRASVLGREFSYDLLKEIAPDSEAALARNLHQLLRDHLLVSVEDALHARFKFRHALIQDAAYETMLRARRSQLHDGVATVLAEKFPEVIERRPEVLADHLTRAHKPEQALPYWLRAGQNATKRSALQEAANLFQRGISLIPDAAGSEDILRLEQRLQVGLGNAIANHTHWGRAEVGQAFERAEQLSRDLGDDVSVFRCKLTLRMSYTSQGHHQQAAEQGMAALQLAQAWDDPHALAQGHAAMVYPHYHLGEFAQAAAQADAGLAALERLDAGRFVLQQRLYLYAYMGESVYIMGDPARARQIMLDGQALVEHVTDPYATSFFFIRGAPALMYLRDYEQLQSHVSEGLRIAAEHGFGSIEAFGEIVQGWLLAMQGDFDAGIALIAQGVPRYFEVGSGADNPFCYLVLAEAQLAGGYANEALDNLALAMAAVDIKQETCHYAEAFRIKGEALVALGQTSEAQQAFQDALDISRGQNALAWELRGLNSQAKLQIKLGDAEGVRHDLAKTIAKLPEGLHTPEMADANRLLGELDAMYE